MPVPFPTVMPSLPSVLGMLLMGLGAYLALGLAQRARQQLPRQRLPWAAAASVALAVGLWSAAATELTGLDKPYDVGFAAGMSAGAMLLALLFGALGLHLACLPGRSRLRAVGSAAALGSAALATQVLLVSAMGVAPAVHWHAPTLAAAWLLASVLAAAGLAAAAHEVSPRIRITARAGAALLLGGGMLAAQSMVIAASGLTALSAQNLSSLLEASTLRMLATVGGMEALLLLLLASVVEARMRGTLEQARAAIQVHSLRDDLTGLPNRNTFEGTLAQAQRQADASKGQAVLLLVALDSFKLVNESHGHQFGDRVLRRMAQRLRKLAQPHRVARLGGDEFLMLLDGEQAAQQAQTLAALVLQSIAQPCSIDDREVSLSCSVGLAVYPQHGAMSALINHAGVAMRAAKAAGGATYSLFDARMVVDTREQAELLRDLRLALSRSQLELYYQPKVHAPSGQITGVEALLRWHHPQRGMMSPTIFIPMAERSGLINALGDWVIDEACRQARVWRDQGMRMRVAVNLSAHQLRQPGLPQRITAALAKHQINPDLLTCEITESVAMEDTEATMRFFTDLAAVGVHISIDDFGSGYSSLAYLRKLPAGELKIDRSFVQDLEHSEEAQKIAQAVVQLAQALNLKVVAEGVETDAQYQILRQFGCNELQGYLFAKPMSAKALGLWAMDDVGPRSIEFRESLFKETQAVEA